MSNGVSGLILVGVGGGGCRMAAAARRVYGEGMEALGFDTDEMAIRALAGLRGHLFGATRLNRQGAGGVHSNGRLAAQDDLPHLLSHLKDARVVVLVTCLGGGTGGGAVSAGLALWLSASTRSDTSIGPRLGVSRSPATFSATRIGSARIVSTRIGGTRSSASSSRPFAARRVRPVKLQSANTYMRIRWTTTESKTATQANLK